MISVIITSYKEPRTIQKAITSILDQNIDCEVLVVAPDDETLDKAKELQKKYKSIRLVRDTAEGKPKALNLAVSEAKGEILVFTDGDVFLGENSIKPILEKLKDKRIGAVTGRPVSLDSKKTKYGFWAHTLLEVANKRRKTAIENKKRFFLSGYFFAIRKELMPKLPEELLSEDGYISHKVYEKGYGLEYSEGSRVYIKYPTNFQDWIIQKKRSAGGYNQIRKLVGVEIRSLRKESLGFTSFFKYASGPKETYWILELFLARLRLWALIYRDINFKKLNREKIWQRVESTK